MHSNMIIPAFLELLPHPQPTSCCTFIDTIITPPIPMPWLSPPFFFHQRDFPHFISFCCRTFWNNFVSSCPEMKINNTNEILLTFWWTKKNSQTPNVSFGSASVVLLFFLLTSLFVCWRVQLWPIFLMVFLLLLALRVARQSHWTT